MTATHGYFVREITLAYGPRTRMPGAEIRTSRDVETLARSIGLGEKLVEHFVAVALDAKNRPVAWSTIAIGTIYSCEVSVGDVLRFALLSGAPSIILVHNHPSGDPHPSRDDIALTQRIVDGAALLGLRVLDHVIVGEDRARSLVDMGIMPGGERPEASS